MKNDRSYDQYSAEKNTALADDYRTRGLDNFAEFHEEEAEKAKRNQNSDDCSFFVFIISVIIQDDYNCDLN